MSQMDRFLRHSLSMWLLLQSFVLMAFCFHSATTCPKGCYCTDTDGYKTVKCSNAHLGEIPTYIPNNTNKLYLDSNQITVIPNDAFRDLHFLSELDLSHNSIGSVEAGAFHGISDSLLSLDLSSNHLQAVNKDTFTSLRAKINLSGNPWHCDCNLQELMSTVNIDTGSSSDIICETAAEEEHSGKPFLQVVKDVGFCNTSKRTTDIAMLVTMFGWFTMVISYLIYYVRQNQEDARRHLEYLKSLPSKQGKSEESSISTVV